jgi:hypothetical protein
MMEVEVEDKGSRVALYVQSPAGDYLSEVAIEQCEVPKWSANDNCSEKYQR